MIPVIVFVTVLLFLIIVALIGVLYKNSKNPFLRGISNTVYEYNGDGSWIFSVILLPFLLVGVGINLVKKVSKKPKTNGKK